MKVKHFQSLHFLQGYNLYLKYLKTVEKYKKYEVRCLKQFENICFRITCNCFLIISKIIALLLLYTSISVCLF